MDSDPTKSSLDFGETKSRSPLRKVEKSMRGMLSRTKLAAKLSLHDSFEMVTDFDPASPDRKRTRETHQLPYLPSPSRKQRHRSTSPSPSPARLRPSAPPVAYRSPRSKQSLPPRFESMPIIPPTPPKDPEDIPLPASPPKSASSWLSFPPSRGGRSGTPVTGDHSPSASDIGTETLHRRSRSHPHINPKPDGPSQAGSEGQTRDIFSEFDQLFADFPHPPAGPPLLSPHLPLPALSSGGGSSLYSASSHPSSRPTTPLTPSAIIPDPARLESAINTLSQLISSLQGTQADHMAYSHRHGELLSKVQSLERELSGRRTDNLKLEILVRREREERTRAEKERNALERGLQRKLDKAEEEQAKANATISTLQSHAQASANTIHTLQSQLSTSQSHSTALENRNHALEVELTRLAGAFEIVKEEYRVKEDEMRRRMEEAEFMHQALKESGARLGRELDGVRKKYSELEKKGRGGFI